MRNVTFNKKLFYSNKFTTIIINKVVKVIKVLYKPSKIIDIGEVIKLSIIVREDLLLKASTK